jgi:hypothetical protein
MPKPKNQEIRKFMTQRPDKTPTEWCEMEPNSSKDKAMHEADNPSF